MTPRELYQLACRMERMVNNHTLPIDLFFSWEKACSMRIRHAAMGAVANRHQGIRCARLVQDTLYTVQTADRARAHCKTIYRPYKGVKS